MNNTNFWDVCVIFFYLLYQLCAWAGTVYLVGWCGWSAWWFLFTTLFMGVHIKTGYGKKQK